MADPQPTVWQRKRTADAIQKGKTAVVPAKGPGGALIATYPQAILSASQGDDGSGTVGTST
jgi:hypothetical protein